LSIGGWQLGHGKIFMILTWTLLLLASVAVLHLLDSRVGRAIRSLRTGSQMAEAMGVNTLRFKIGIFLMAALLASLSGWLYAHYQRSVNPSPFGIRVGIEYLFMAVLGGAGYVWGAITGVAITLLLADQLQVLLPKIIGTSGSYEIIVFGVVLVLVLKYAPDGIWAFIDRKLPRAARKANWQKAALLATRPRPVPGELVLQASSIRKEFGGLVAVNDISFSVSPGQIVGLIGPNGAGKSTTFNLITGVLPLTGCRVSFRGEDISSLRSREIARLGISRTFQHVKMIPDMTVLENVALGAHLRGSKGFTSAMLRLDRAQEQSLLKEAAQQLQRVGMGSHLHEPAWPWASSACLKSLARCAATQPCCCSTSLRLACATLKSRH
jgi:branched-chain amino acid transport system permease protein